MYINIYISQHSLLLPPTHYYPPNNTPFHIFGERLLTMLGFAMEQILELQVLGLVNIKPFHDLYSSTSLSVAAISSSVYSINSIESINLNGNIIFYRSCYKTHFQ